MKLRTVEALPLSGGEPRPLASFAGGKVHAVAGIGIPSASSPPCAPPVSR